MDPTKQADIDKKMIEEIDGTQNEWGWCKKKVNALLLTIPSPR